MKKKIVSLCLCVALLAVAVGGTLAYFTDTTETKDNVFTVGNVEIELTEEDWEKEEHEDVYPGEALPKDPCVENKGDNPCFVRIKVTGLDCLGANNMITYETGYETGKLGENWADGGDGYFYYVGVLASGAKTSDLFDQIRIPTTVTNGYDGTYDVQVYAEAVQAQGAMPKFSDVENMDLTAIKAWFDTCMPRRPL